ncbi:MAG: bifunctional demethylmenaquinone methyltransferase/2-methoxy-6-polyprenyl-1,4-benzoquinol methylase UbiE [Muribaculaceae bacterium]|nr:bifunctional demethylmenaquinone methyltransferase/2-methoxy-6-polyprenyl-1,4-benzoquinol methylase UbiE [Muribaculaceae bacterium]
MEVKAEKINPYVNDSRPKTEQVRDMFDSIAPAYDFMNRAMTFGIDKWWRSLAVKMLRKHGVNEILDIATGTADLAIKLAVELHPDNVTGIDLSEKMVELGRHKVDEKGLADKVTLLTGDCLSLPFTDNRFDCVTVAYGVRNFEHLDRGYAEMFRVLKPGGIVCVIELSTPTSPLVKPFYRLYTRTLIPAVGRLISKDTRAYSYLPESIAAVPQGESMLQLMREAGFTDCRCRSLTFGTCSIYTAIKK